MIWEFSTYQRYISINFERAHNSSNASVASVVYSSVLIWGARATCSFIRHFCDNHACVIVKKGLEEPGTAPVSFYTNEFFRTVPRLPVPRLPPGGSLGTPKILGTGAILHLGPIRLHVENLECRALKSSAWCQKFGVPCRFVQRV